MGVKRKSVFNKESGQSIVTIQEKGKVFIGKAQTHADDMDVNCMFTGLTIADTKAQIKRFNYKAKRTREQINALKRQIAHLERLESDQLDKVMELEEDLFMYLEHKQAFASKLRTHRKTINNKE